MEREDGSLPPPLALSRTTHVLRCPVRLAGRSVRRAELHLTSTGPAPSAPWRMRWEDVVRLVSVGCAVEQKSVTGVKPSW